MKESSKNRTEFIHWISSTCAVTYYCSCCSCNLFFYCTHLFLSFFVIVKARRAEAETAGETAGRCLAVLRKLFPEVKVPGPVHAAASRWGADPWARGSYRCVSRCARVCVDFVVILTLVSPLKSESRQSVDSTSTSLGKRMRDPDGSLSRSEGYYNPCTG